MACLLKLCGLTVQYYTAVVWHQQEHLPGLHSYSTRTTVHISTAGQQLAVIGTLPCLSWERSKGAFGHGQAALSTN